MGSEQRVIVRFLYRKEVAPAEIHIRLKAHYRDDADNLCSAMLVPVYSTGARKAA
jgi:hypothetical protein